MKTGVDVREATHVVVGGRTEKIVEKIGVRADGRLDPSFSVKTESGQIVDMWHAQSYIKE